MEAMQDENLRNEEQRELQRLINSIDLSICFRTASSILHMETVFYRRNMDMDL